MPTVRRIRPGVLRFSSEVAFHMLDSVFSSLIPTIYRFGGDVLRITGDAMYIVWTDHAVRPNRRRFGGCMCVHGCARADV